nr:zinc finger protein CONSTANS-LIKE 16-like [Ipomoea batatas]
MVSSSDKKLASAVGAKTARACDSCIRRRARWYCAADDAFLCQSCDSSVHNANLLARRHERVRLKSSDLKTPDDFPSLESLARSWPHGFTRKARTPRGRKQAKPKSEPEQSFTKHPFDLVPEIYSDENSHNDESDEQLLYRVPVFDGFAAEMCTSARQNEAGAENIPDVRTNIPASLDCRHNKDDGNKATGIVPSEIELAEFAADVESLLGKGLDDESFNMEGLGLFSNFNKVKLETDEEAAIANNHNVAMKFDNCDDNSPVAMCDEEYDERGGEFATILQQSDDFDYKTEKKKILLKLDYEGVITAWADQRSPWTNGERPDLDSNDCWPDFTGVVYEFQGQNVKKSEIWGEKTKRQGIQCVKWGSTDYWDRKLERGGLTHLSVGTPPWVWLDHDGTLPITVDAGMDLVGNGLVQRWCGAN